MSPSDLMLLDEPTNHLDLDAIVWLEEWLERYPGTLVIISHDRDFLDSAINVTLHLDSGTLKRYGGNYSTFEKERAIQLAVQQSAFVKQQAHIAHLESFIARFKAKASKARQAQSRVKALERMTLVAPAHASSPVQFEFYDAGQSPNPMIHMDHVACGYPAGGSDASLRPDPGTGKPTVILGNVSLTLIPGQRIGVLGANGQVLASAGGSNAALVPERPAAALLRQARLQRSVGVLAGLDDEPQPGASPTARVRAVALVPNTDINLAAANEERFLMLVQPLPDALVANALAVQAA
jgi:hypothetical protein